MTNLRVLQRLVAAREAADRRLGLGVVDDVADGFVGGDDGLGQLDEAALHGERHVR